MIIDLPTDSSLVAQLGIAYFKGFQKDVHRNAVRKRFWKKNGTHNPAEKIALIHSELSELLEEFRNVEVNEETKAEEAADVLIRLLDFCEYYNIDLIGAALKKHEINRQRPAKHGRKF